MLSCGADKVVKFWGVDGFEIVMFGDYIGDVISVSVYFLNSYFVFILMDKIWGFYDFITSSCIILVNDDIDFVIMCVNFYFDGVILGVGMKDLVVKFWDVKDVCKLF